MKPKTFHQLKAGGGRVSRKQQADPLDQAVDAAMPADIRALGKPYKPPGPYKPQLKAAGGRLKGRGHGGRG
jgi:hypothetical protein